MKWSDGILCCFIFILQFFDVCTLAKLYIKPETLSLKVHGKGNFSVYLSEPLNENVYINFKYLPKLVTERLPENASIEANSTGPITYEVTAVHASKVTIQVITSQNVDTEKAFINLKIKNLPVLDIISIVIGWMYFVAWSISFYPQLILNIKRKSVVGLDFNFLALNVVGFLCYAIFNIALYSSPVVQKEYFEVHKYSIIPVHVNDIVFAVHAFIVSSVISIQCLIYDRGNQKVSLLTWCLLGGIGVFLLVSLILSLTHVINYLLYMQFFSYVKLGITIIKYVPQAAYNYFRKSTTGWSIGNVLLDFTGGALSMGQMFIDAYNYDSWIILFGNLTKFGLGLFSVLFDILFMVQHYCLYKDRSEQHTPYNEIDGKVSSEYNPSDEPRADASDKILLVT
ncbi:CTNS (predicted) [Pycnogonum litorale]